MDDSIIYGPNWKIIKPSFDELNTQSKLSRFHTNEEKECLLCHSKFNYGFKKSNNCNLPGMWK